MVNDELFVGVDDFIPALTRLRASNPEVVIEDLYRFFSAIAKMNRNQVTAAFQTVNMVSEEMGLGKDRRILHILEALRVRMCVLADTDGVGFGGFWTLIGTNPTYIK